jgi:hypothetical protein
MSDDHSTDGVGTLGSGNLFYFISSVNVAQFSVKFFNSLQVLLFFTEPSVFHIRNALHTKDAPPVFFAPFFASPVVRRSTRARRLNKQSFFC